jgi:hypothetical protein
MLLKKRAAAVLSRAALSIKAIKDKHQRKVQL